MKDRFVILPFSIGCVSESSVAVVDNRPKKSQRESNEGALQPREINYDEKPRGSLIATGFQRIVKGFKNFSSQLFTVYEEDDEDDGEMEIGFPTDVQHVAHIGWDGLANNTSMNTIARRWIGGDQELTGGSHQPDLLSLSSFSVRQFEMAMSDGGGGGRPATTSHGPFML